MAKDLVDFKSYVGIFATFNDGSASFVITQKRKTGWNRQVY